MFYQEWNVQVGQTIINLKVLIMVTVGYDDFVEIKRYTSTWPVVQNFNF